ncbi:MAG: UDP-N-acetyl-D-glucosamine dehydrogenase, partial [Candidatus Zixiibacteriota bacterium]
IELAGDINSHMPEYVAERISDLFNKRLVKAINKSSILVLGVAYKKDIQDIRESPALDVIKLLEDKGARVTYNDPYVSSFAWKGKPLKSVKLNAQMLKKADLVVILTNHTDYDYQWIVDNSRVVFDTRNATRDVARGRNKIELL